MDAHACDPFIETKVSCDRPTVCEEKAFLVSRADLGEEKDKIAAVRYRKCSCFQSGCKKRKRVHPKMVSVHD
jgi:hypothetical protein